MYSPSSEKIVLLIIFCLLAGLVQSVIVGLIIYRFQKKKNDYRRNVEDMQLKYENEILQSQVEIQEQTFENISRDIHDNIGQKLTLAKLQLNKLAMQSDKQTADLEDTIRIIGETISDLSDLSRSMSPALLLNNGLAKALEFEIAQIAKTGVFKIDFKNKGDMPFMEERYELYIFRIVQECLNNIIKHAAASLVQLTLEFSADNCHIQIKDDGLGFDSNQQESHGAGLYNIRRRTSMMGGELVISSARGAGTEINIKIPLYGTIKTN